MQNRGGQGGQVSATAREFADRLRLALRRRTDRNRREPANGPTLRPGLPWIETDAAQELERAGRVRIVLGRDGPAVLVIRTSHGIFAFYDRCPHLGRTLSDGDIRGTRIRCHGHSREYRFDSSTPVRQAGLTTVGVELRHGRLYLNLSGRCTNH